MRRSATALLGLLTVAMLGGCASHPPLRQAKNVDLDRYMGRWHVIANVPYIFEKGKVATVEEYQRTKEGIKITFHFQKGFDKPQDAYHGKAWLPDANNAALWKVQMVWPFTSDYTIVDLTPDNSAVLVGIPSRKLAWIMARDTTLPDAEYQRLLGVARSQGFPVDKMRKVPQMRSQIGQPGFQ